MSSTPWNRPLLVFEWLPQSNCFWPKFAWCVSEAENDTQAKSSREMWERLIVSKDRELEFYQNQKTAASNYKKMILMWGEYSASVYLSRSIRMKLHGLNLAKTSALHLAEDRTRFVSILWRVIERFGGGRKKWRQTRNEKDRPKVKSEA